MDMDDKYKIEFLSKNMEHIYYGLLDKTFERALSSKLDKKIGTWHTHNIFSCNGLEGKDLFSLKETYETNMKRFDQFVKKNFKDRAEYNLYIGFLDLGFIEIKGKGSFKRSDPFDFYCYNLLQYAVHGSLKEYSEYDQFSKSYSEIWYRFTEIPELGNIKLRAYQNGRFDVKGLTPDQNRRIDEILQLVRKKLKPIS